MRSNVRLAAVLASGFAGLAMLEGTVRLASHLRDRSGLLGLAVLDATLGAAISQFPRTRFVGFSAGGDEDEQYREIFTRHGADYWPDFAAHVAASPVRTNCAPLDTHWNREGNRIAGEMLASLLSEMGPVSWPSDTEGQ